MLYHDKIFPDRLVTGMSGIDAHARLTTPDCRSDNDLISVYLDNA